MKRGSLLALLSFLLMLSAISLFIGVRNITPWGLLQASEDQLQVFVISRVPRLIAILTAGASMSVAGLIMQQLARNKFVSPSTAGTMESASLGVLVATIGFGSASVLQKMTIAFVFALVGTLIFMRILERAHYRDVIIVPLVGIMFGGVIGACTTFIALRYDLLQSLDSWMNGDFSGVLRGRYELLYIAVPLTVVAYLFADRFTLAGMGADFATNLGLNYKQVVHLGLAIIALATAVVVLTVGAIPFLGLIIPNVVTIVLGDNIKKNLPYTALLGAIFVLICDIAGRTIRYPYEIPISLIVGVVGSIMFLFLICGGAYMHLHSEGQELSNVFAAAASTSAPNQQRLLPKLLLLAVIAGALIALFLTIGVSDWGFALPRRGRKVAAMLLVGFSITYSSVIFQTITNNRILTPSIIGFDSLYLLLQTVIVFVFGGIALATINKNLQFAINVGLMVLFAGLLYRWLFQREGRNLYFLILVGIIFGTLFGSITSFMQRMIDPNDFVVLQDRMFASFNSVNEGLLVVSTIGVILATLYSLRYAKNLDVLSLGRDHAINLGVAHATVVNRLMVVIAILVSIATALVGPITFFGLLVANLAYQFMRTYRHIYLIPAATLISVIALTGGQLLVERVFTFSTSLSVIINFVGGIYFIYLLLRETRA